MSVKKEHIIKSHYLFNKIFANQNLKTIKNLKILIREIKLNKILKKKIKLIPRMKNK